MRKRSCVTESAYCVSVADSQVAEDKDKEDLDKLGPLRPTLAPSKSAPSVPAVARDLKDRQTCVVTLRCLTDSGGKHMPKSASASLLSLSMPSTAITTAAVVLSQPAVPEQQEREF
jgi:anaerobic glycerol-3-phosphate dehydrogenase